MGIKKRVKKKVKKIKNAAKKIKKVQEGFYDPKSRSIQICPDIQIYFLYPGI